MPLQSTQVRLTEKVRKLAHIRAAMLGMKYSEYISHLIKQDARNAEKLDLTDSDNDEVSA